MPDVLTHNFDEALAGLVERSKDYTHPLTNWYGYMLRQTQLTFTKLGKKGSGTFRGVSWKWFADQYTRKDGTVVPAQGIQGQVKARKRNSGKLITTSSRVMQDRSLLKHSAMAKLRMGKQYLVARTPTTYAEFQAKLRQFAFITKVDEEILINMIEKYLAGADGK